MRRGQVALYLLMTIVVLAVVTFMNVDIFLAVRAKNRVQNAGDAAALAAARVQGENLNRLGALNIAHIVAAAENDSDLCRAIELEQRRLALLGPVEALRKANEAAAANGMKKTDDDRFAKILREHVETIRMVYSGGVNADGDPYPEPWEGAWMEYASAIEQVIAGGLVTGPDNCEYYDARGGHLLLMRNFYHAIAGRNWCWFHFNAANTLSSYANWHGWSALPSRKTNTEGNCELFSLHVAARTGALTDTFTFKEIAALASKWGSREVSEAEVTLAPELTNSAAVWFYFEPAAWGRWFDGRRLAGTEDGYEFPLVGEVRPAYNVRGASAVCRCVATGTSILGEDATSYIWSAAAKPFGRIADDLEGDIPVTARKFFVLPVFDAVRLIPLDAAGSEDLATADYDWVQHVRHHLNDSDGYLARGPRSGAACYYCRQLVDWERPTIRRTGLEWLKHHSKTCVRGTGGPGSHGGTPHGH